MITPEIVTAYTQCKLRAYLLMRSNQQAADHEYVAILRETEEKNREVYIDQVRNDIQVSERFSLNGMERRVPVLYHAVLENDGMTALADMVEEVGSDSPQRMQVYAPIIVVGTYKISKEQKFRLAYTGYVLAQIQKEKPKSGKIVTSGGKVNRIKLGSFYKEVETVIKNLRVWRDDSSNGQPALILNKHCPSCAFLKTCESRALDSDDLSLLGGISEKEIYAYHKKGIFTITQLSYLFRPRKQHKRGKHAAVGLRYRASLHALAIRTRKIYIQEMPQLAKSKVSLYLDIEGVPDEDLYYLIGLLVVNGDQKRRHSFWADSKAHEGYIWDSFKSKVKEYPDAPIYHYGAYDAKAVQKLADRYENGSGSIIKRLVNVNSSIYGKLYFPVRTNSLKDLGTFVGASWSHPKASGLQSLVWRHRWGRSRNDEYRALLESYNQEDCEALYLLVAELIKIIETADTKWNVDFADKPKKHATNIGAQIHNELERVLEYAHADYERTKIHLQDREHISEEKDCQDGSNRPGYVRIAKTPSKVIRVPPRKKCPRCKSGIEVTDKFAEITVTDLVFGKNGCRKTTIKYCGKKVFCRKCKEHYNPRMIKELNGRVFGHAFMAWTAYQRIILRLPYKVITQVMEDMFSERTSQGTVVQFVRNMAVYYNDTERLLIQRLRESSFIHVDETKINIQGEDQYAWVFTDGKHVIFRKTATREASIVHEFLSGFTGILISDFYPGYDAVECRQQKCWSHLIRDINEDLWKEPFNQEFELFVVAVRNLIVPILESIQRFGSKKRHLNKYKRRVEQFYKKNIDSSVYTFEVTIKYQKRFRRYRDSLFVFLEEDGIPWNNNMAERALRHLAVQRKISGTFFDSFIADYLLLLGIAQSCRFQDKNFLRFMLSQEKDVDLFKRTRPLKYSRMVTEKT